MFYSLTSLQCFSSVFVAGEKMEQGAVDQLLSSLPNDLAEYVADDNSKFRDERNKWDADQEEKRKRESVQAATSTTGTQMKENDSNGECEVCILLQQYGPSRNYNHFSLCLRLLRNA